MCSHGLDCLLAANPKVTEAPAILEPSLNSAGAEVRAALAQAHLKPGDSFCCNENLPPWQKCRPALIEYRNVLKYDKAIKDATAKIKLIESI